MKFSLTNARLDGERVGFSEEEDFTKVDWAGAGVELVIDCTGVFLTTLARALAQRAGAAWTGLQGIDGVVVSSMFDAVLSDGSGAATYHHHPSGADPAMPEYSIYSSLDKREFD